MHFWGTIALIYCYLRRSIAFWLDKSYPKGFVEICVFWNSLYWSIRTSPFPLSNIFFRSRPYKPKEQVLNEHIATADWNLVQVLRPSGDSARTREEEMPHELSLSHTVPRREHKAWWEASSSGFHFQWLAMEMGVIFDSLFYPSSTAQFLPPLVFFPLGW